VGAPYILKNLDSTTENLVRKGKNNWKNIILMIEIGLVIGFLAIVVLNYFFRFIL
jgi:hypothetical protein